MEKVSRKGRCEGRKVEEADKRKYFGSIIKT